MIIKLFLVYNFLILEKNLLLIKFIIYFCKRVINYRLNTKYIWYFDKGIGVFPLGPI